MAILQTGIMYKGWPRTFTNHSDGVLPYLVEQAVKVVQSVHPAHAAGALSFSMRNMHNYKKRIPNNLSVTVNRCQLRRSHKVPGECQSAKQYIRRDSSRNGKARCGKSDRCIFSTHPCKHVSGPVLSGSASTPIGPPFIGYAGRALVRRSLL